MSLLKKSFVYLLFLFIFFYCKSGNEELASFKNGKVTRSELRAFYKLKGLEENPKTASIKNQISILENLSILKIVELENEKQGLFKSQDFKDLFSLYKKILIADLFRREYFKKAKHKEDVELVIAQLIQLTASSENTETDPKVNQVWKELTSLNDDKKIFDYIVENTEELGSKPIGGYIDPQCVNCGNNPVIDILREGLQKDDEKFYKYKTNQTVFIYRIIEKKKIKPVNIKSFFVSKLQEYRNYALEFKKNAQTDEEKKLASYYAEGNEKLEYKASKYEEFITNKFLEVNWNEKVNKIQKENNISISKILNKPVSELKEEDFKDDTVLLSSPKTKYTYLDLKNHYDIIKNFKKNPNSKNELQNRIHFFLNEYLLAAIIAETEHADRIKKSEDYETSLNYLKREISFSTFIDKIKSQNVSASEEEIKQAYEAGKLYSYTVEDPNNPGKKITLPLDQVRDKIRSEIISTKFKKSLEKEMDEIKKSNNLKIHSEKLKEGSL